jgi:hypothetical protein
MRSCVNEEQTHPRPSTKQTAANVGLDGKTYDLKTNDGARSFASALCLPEAQTEMAASLIIDAAGSERNKIASEARRWAEGEDDDTCVTGMGRCMLLGDQTLRARDRGEWDGSLNACKAGASGEAIFDRAGVRALAATSAGVIAVVDYAYGASGLVEIGMVEGEPRAVSMTCLRGHVQSMTVADDGTLLLGVMNTVIAVDDDGTLYDLACDDEDASHRLDAAWANGFYRCERGNLFNPPTFDSPTQSPTTRIVDDGRPARCPSTGAR